MTAALLVAELKAVSCGVTLRGDRLLIAVPLGAARRPELIARLRAAKPALVAHLRERCAHCGEPEGAGGVLLPIGTHEDGHWLVHIACYGAWLAERRRQPPPRPEGGVRGSRGHPPAVPGTAGATTL